MGFNLHCIIFLNYNLDFNQDVATLSAEFTALALDPLNTTLVFRKGAWLANSIKDATAQTR